MKQFVLLASLLAFSGAFTACSGNDNAPSSTGETGMSSITTLQVTDVKVGTGAEATNGKVVTVHYTGWLYSETAANHHGSQFDSSVSRGKADQSNRLAAASSVATTYRGNSRWACWHSSPKCR